MIVGLKKRFGTVFEEDMPYHGNDHGQDLDMGGEAIKITIRIFRRGDYPAYLTNLLLRSGIPALVRTSLDSRLCRVSTQLHPLIGAKPTPALDLRSLATNFVRYAG